MNQGEALLQAASRRELYTLTDKTRAPLCVTDPVHWAMWNARARASGDHVVARDSFSKDGVACLVSTIFVGIDQSLVVQLADPRPRVFETLVFGGLGHGTRYHYATWQEADEGHDRAMRALEAGLLRSDAATTRPVAESDCAMHDVSSRVDDATPTTEAAEP